MKNHNNSFKKNVLFDCCLLNFNISTQLDRYHVFRMFTCRDSVRSDATNWHSCSDITKSCNFFCKILGHDLPTQNLQHVISNSLYMQDQQGAFSRASSMKEGSSELPSGVRSSAEPSPRRSGGSTLFGGLGFLRSYTS